MRHSHSGKRVTDNHDMNSPLTSHPVIELRRAALAALLETNCDKKVDLAQQLQGIVATLSIASSDLITEPSGLPGCPLRPELRAHLDVPRRSPHTPEGLAALIHAVTHIEFNAINLALDAIWRFADMPDAYYRDWLRVAAEESQHFNLLRGLLCEMGYDYGDFAAHTGLWDMLEKTRDDVLARMALVPRTLEARGLDATPPMQSKLRKVGTPHAARAVAILDVILADEIGHVSIGNHWYRHLCAARGLEPVATYAVLAAKYSAPRLRGPLNLQARRLAGFDELELALLQDAA